MESTLDSPPFPVDLVFGFAQDEETMITMQCHDRVFQDVEVGGSYNERLFTVESPGIKSMSWRRTLKDAYGLPLFELRKFYKYGVNRKWGVTDSSGRELCSLRHASTLTQFHALDVSVPNRAGGQEPVIKVRPMDQRGRIVEVAIEGATVAVIQMTDANLRRSHFQEDISAWTARVAGGVDLTLIVAIMLCRAEMLHTWRK